MKTDPRTRRRSTPKRWALGWNITKAEAKELMAEGTWTQDPENTSDFAVAYVSDRGELIRLRPRGKSILYASRAELMEKMAESAKLPFYTHMLTGLLPQGAHFIEAIPSLLDDLAARLKLPRESLDLSLESLEAVDAALKKVRPRKKILEVPNFFASLVAYTGEVMRNHVHGYWRLREVEGNIFEPYVHVGPELHPHLDPFSGIFRALYEPTRGGLSLAAIASGEIMGFQIVVASRQIQKNP